MTLSIPSDVDAALSFFEDEKRGMSITNKKRLLSVLSPLKSTGEFDAVLRFVDGDGIAPSEAVCIPCRLPGPLHSLDTTPVKARMLANFQTAALERMEAFLVRNIADDSALSQAKRELAESPPPMVEGAHQLSAILNGTGGAKRWSAWISRVAATLSSEVAKEAVLKFGRRFRLYDPSNGWSFTHILGRLADAKRNRGDCYAQAYHNVMTKSAPTVAKEEGLSLPPAPKRARLDLESTFVLCAP